MGVPGFEPGTSALSELRSNQLSYTPLVGYAGECNDFCEFTSSRSGVIRVIWQRQMPTVMMVVLSSMI